MKTNLFLAILLVLCIGGLNAAELKSIKEFGVKPENSASVNKVNLQKAIDWATTIGAALYVEPTDEPYHVDGGIILKKNVSDAPITVENKLAVIQAVACFDKDENLYNKIFNGGN